ncbi:hypothetical protein K461DRAFT_297957 [Myriangium duriaei CBS 260.36]|uniref:JmjC domain-containing protein n=1 Tax=Myriangium duriaei CBS 260.36 TaxID=1168546 RepID=A0A9P4IUB4_9PEZI|nr:hypothetical protein K461DRAFT_297957 [Myriangium duriaei CBS 260.36]
MATNTAEDPQRKSFSRYTFSGKLFKGNQLLQYHRKDLSEWLVNFLEQNTESDYLEKKLVGFSVANIISPEQLENFEVCTAMIVAKIYSPGKMSMTDAFLTPKGSLTEIHHDSETQVIIAKGRQSFAVETALKVWLFWPPSKMEYLPQYYCKTELFFNAAGPPEVVKIQYQDSIIVVPANWIHAVITLEDCYILGANFDDPSQIRFMRAEECGGEKLAECMPVAIQKLKIDLMGKHRRSILRQFVRNIPMDLSIYRNYAKESLIDALRGVMDEDGGNCLYCEILNVRPTARAFITDTTDSTWTARHICSHLYNEIPGTSRGEAAYQLWYQMTERELLEQAKYGQMKPHRKRPKVGIQRGETSRAFALV